ncbi:T9SS type A sorting domain-containing protein [Mariniphaga sp.]|jgi:hypothetical protein|uniref:T9SS type A sorting domain-containing protein n=1 Tax=Mariniphaga sp. TaxID=1954475 RepID=UPI003562A871
MKKRKKIHLVLLLEILAVLFSHNSYAQDFPSFVNLKENIRVKNDSYESGKEKGYFDVDYNDSAWEEFLTPSELTNRETFLVSQKGFSGATWFRKEFNVPQQWTGKSVHLVLGTSKMNHFIYLNGDSIGRSGTWVDKSFDVSEYIIPGNKNVLTTFLSESDGTEGLHQLNRLRITITDPICNIGLSKAIPVVSDTVTITGYMDNAENSPITLELPDGSIENLKLNALGQLKLVVNTYGKYTISCQEYERIFYATAVPLMFHFWSPLVLPKYATHMLSVSQESKFNDYYIKNGTKLSGYGYGYGLENLSVYSIKDYWKKSLNHDDYSGITIDELYVHDSEYQMKLHKALWLLYEEKGGLFECLPYVAGIEYKTGKAAWNLRKAKAICFSENYYGGDELTKKRWSDMKESNLDYYGGLLSMSPGFVLNIDQTNVNYGPLTAYDLKKEFASYRRIAPEMNGISFFNAYFAVSLESLLDENIIDFFFKPVIHIHPKGGHLAFQNIGNEDIPEGVIVQFISVLGEEIGSTKLPSIKPTESVNLILPDNTKKIHFEQPKHMVSLYPDNTYYVPEELNPLQIDSCTVSEGDIAYKGQQESFFVKVQFNQKIRTLFNSGIANIIQNGGGVFSPEKMTFNDETNILLLEYKGLREGEYGLNLKSGLNGFKSLEGALLDGTDNGLLDTKYSDDYNVFFILKYKDVNTSVVNDNFGNSMIKLYPNPANSRLNVEIAGIRGMFHLRSIQGKTLLEKELTKGNNTISLGKIADGFYIANITEGSHIHVEKVIVKKNIYIK